MFELAGLAGHGRCKSPWFLRGCALWRVRGAVWSGDMFAAYELWSVGVLAGLVTSPNISFMPACAHL